MHDQMKQDKLIGRISLKLLPFLFLLYIISYLDRINLSFAALQMNQELQFSDQAFGLGAGIFFLGYCLFGIPSNFIIEKLGPRRWISIIMVVWGIVTVLMCQVKDPLSFALMRFLLGAAEAGFFPGMLLYLTYWFPRRHYGTAVARFMTAIPAAGLLGSAVAAYALSIHGFLNISGWKWLFIVTGGPAVLIGLLIPFLMPDRPRHAAWLKEEEVDLLERMLSAEAAQATPDQPAAKERNALLLPVVWLFALIYFTLTVSMYGFTFWLPQIIKAFESQQSDVTTSLLAAIPALFQAAGMLLVAGSSDRRKERTFHLAFANLLTFLGLVLTGLAPQPVLKLAGLCLSAFGIWGAVGPFWALTRQTLSQNSQAAGLALINSVGNLGGFAGPYLIGLIKQHSQGNFTASLLTLASASVFATILLVLQRQRQSKDSATAT